MVSKQCVEYRSKFQEAATLDEDKLTLMKQTVFKLQELLAKAHKLNA